MEGIVCRRRHFSISPEQLLLDLYRAYKDARKHKRGRKYQLEFEYNLESNLVALRDELFAGVYRPLPSTCFIIHEPKMREVFAADFRDRIVHHLFYNYTHELFERTFVHDCYSCIKGRGTHFGIERLKHHIRSVSAGYSAPCFVLKIDVKGYFMNINRETLIDICRRTLEKSRCKALCNVEIQAAPLDYGFVDYLLETIIGCDPVENCVVRGQLSDWDNLPAEKSLFGSKTNCGLPIGNLSSQLFSNIYMNVFDQYMKRSLGCKHYGRYVDDAYVVSGSAEFLKSIIPAIDAFLRNSLGLALNLNKVRVYDICYGVEFLGAYLKPFRTYVSAGSLKRIKKKIGSCRKRMDYKYVHASANSFLGVLSHYNSFCLRRVLFGNVPHCRKYGRFSGDWLKFY